MKVTTRALKLAAAGLGAAALLAAAGCTGEDASPKAELEQALAQLSAAKSYAFQSTATFKELQLPKPAADEAEKTEGQPDLSALMAELTKGMTIQMDGIYQREPMRTDANVKLTLPSAPMELTLPMIMTGDKVYLQVPDLIPTELAGKYVVIDSKKLAQEKGEPMQQLDPSVQQRLLLEAGAAFMKPFEEKTYFKSLKPDEANLPQGVEADSIVQFQADGAAGDQAMALVAEQALPAVLDVVLANEAYLQALGLDKAEAEASRKELADPNSELSKQLREQLKLEQVKLIGAIKDGKLAYQSMDLNAAYTDPQGADSFKAVLSGTTTYSKLDEPAAFTQEIPADAQPIGTLAEALGAAAPPAR
ncbi:hypothetical protein HGI30_00620 [Paenibacillus albicereus]|uniref:Lipoprotein n=1 Tax=Paenibacillus albicereus TaxID=2726185 RepID=A0A6H2GS67_9BACL|nr:hypothetical protein [Paenibacillus albicereus]QJC50252.1 hypothetical protein HGI30_00620 [Paenibacillus albicereus]